MTNKEIAIDFLKMTASGEIQEAFQQYAATSMIHHNPYYKGDVMALMQAMKEDSQHNPKKKLTVLRALADGEGVAVHSFVRQNPDHRGIVLAHFFTFQDQKITELWDVGQEVPEDIVNKNGML